MKIVDYKVQCRECGNEFTFKKCLLLYGGKYGDLGIQSAMQ